jgi:flavoprotein
MVKIQIELSEEEDRIVELYKLTNRLKTKQEAIKKMVKFFEAEIRPKRMNDKEYFK